MWVFASTPLDDQTKQKLSELGEVKCVSSEDSSPGRLIDSLDRYIVAGNIEHNMFVKDYKDAWPSATTIGPEDLNAKLQGWQLDQGMDLISR